MTGLGVTPHKYPADQTIAGRVNQHLQTLYRAQQSMIYAALLRPQPRRADGDAMDSLLALQEELTARKALVRAYLNLFYPDSMLDSDVSKPALRARRAAREPGRTKSATVSSGSQGSER